tara:strand:+ start:234 stop:545 length:312 start_codon:yes stop_codon:yes gene_type:complete
MGTIMSSDLRIQPAIDNGDLPSDWQICNTCRGNGHHKRIDQRVLEGWGETSYIYEDCEDCESTGKIDLSKKKEPYYDDDWLEEIAMEEGMLGGIDAYNEVKGY